MRKVRGPIHTFRVSGLSGSNATPRSESPVSWRLVIMSSSLKHVTPEHLFVVLQNAWTKNLSLTIEIMVTYVSPTTNLWYQTDSNHIHCSQSGGLGRQEGSSNVCQVYNNRRFSMPGMRINPLLRTPKLSFSSALPIVVKAWHESWIISSQHHSIRKTF